MQEEFYHFQAFAVNHWLEILVLGYPSDQPRLVSGSSPAGWGEEGHFGQIPPSHAGQHGE